VAAIDYEETVVWQPDPQHKYVALREVTQGPNLPETAETASVEPKVTAVDNATTGGPKLPASKSQKAEPTAKGASKDALPIAFDALYDFEDKLVILVFFVCVSLAPVGQTVTLKMPETAKSKGICASDDQEPVLELTWPVFRFILMFSRTPAVNDKGSWKVSGLEIQFNTNSPFFPGATNPGKRTARTGDNVTLFETPMGESYFCPTPKLVALTDSRGGRKVAVQFKDLRIQAYEFQGTYGPAHRCSQVRMAGVQDPFPQDETVPIVVGSTLAVAAVAVVVGYALYRSVFVRRVDYNTMN
ncbi:unnamed protein product, partial [Ixodes persulcatus]